MGFSHVLCLCLQGGGVYVESGTVTFSSCTITGNTAKDYVRAHVRKFPSPRWEFMLTCPIDSHLSIRIDIWFYQANVRASHACKLPIAPMGFSQVSRLCLQGGGVYISSGTVSFSSCIITGNSAGIVRAHAQKFPSPPWERLMFCSFLQGGGVYVYSGTVTMTSCSITGNTAAGAVRAHVQNFPLPRWEDG